MLLSPKDGQPGTEKLTPIMELDKFLEDLINFSLIEQENLDKAGNQRRFRVSPFVDAYI